MAEAPYNSDRLATVFGGSGFVGRHIVRALAREGWRVRVAVRRPDLAGFLNTLGVVGQIEAVQANLRYPESVKAAVEGAQAVVNAAGVKRQSGQQSYEAVHVAGAGEVARAASAAGVGALVHVSGVGADAASGNPYIASKGRGEAAVREAFADAIVLRPSVLFGPEDDSSIDSPRWRRYCPSCRCSAAGRRNCSRSSSATSRWRRRARSTARPLRGEPTNSAVPR